MDRNAPDDEIEAFQRAAEPGDPVAHLEALDVRPDLRDDAHRLVPENIALLRRGLYIPLTSGGRTMPTD